MKKIATYISACAFIALATGCVHRASEAKEMPETAMRELPLPEVPESLTEPEERAAFVVEHFWDSLDFKNDAEALDTTFMGQSFANYLSVLPYADLQVAQHSVDALMRMAAKRQDSRRLLQWIARHYLDDPDSPMRSEDIYILFLKAGIANPASPEDKERAEYRLMLAMRNRPGSRAADLRISLREGSDISLHDAVAPDTTLVIFYDPECSNCKAMIERLASPDYDVNHRILAVDAGGNRDLWDATKWSLPAGWSVAFALEDVEEGKYHLPALPSLYLLAPDATVILKDFTLP